MASVVLYDSVTAQLKTAGMWTREEPTVLVFTDENGAPTDACAQIGGNNLPHRGGKCSIWEGGTKGIAIISSPLITQANVTYHGLAHAVDWLPTLVVGVLGGSTAKTKPLDGHNLWNALLHNDPSQSTRDDIYYGITDSAVGHYGPALRTVDGMKIIVGGWGGGKGQYKLLNDTYVDGTPGSSLSLTTLHLSLAAERPLFFGRRMEGEPELNVTAGKCCPGDVSHQFAGVKNTSACNNLCIKFAKQGCKAFTMNFDEDICYLKSRATCSSNGHCDCGHPGVLPGACSHHKPPSPPMHNTSKVLLYNVESDTGESMEMSDQHPDIVSKLHQLVVKHEKTGIPQATPATQGTTACGPAKPSQDNSSLGQGRLYWGPWC